MQDIDFNSPKVILLVGRPKRGKSNAIKFLILKNTVDKKIFNFGIVMTKTAFNNIDYTFLPESNIIEGYDEEILMNYINKLKDMVKKKIKFNAFLVMDDLIGVLSRNDPFLINLWSIHRHVNLSIFIATQHLKGSSSNTTLREVTTNGLFFRSLRGDTQKSIWDEFARQFDKFEVFKKHFLKVTDTQYHAMFYDADANDLQSNFWSIKYPDMSKNKIKLKF